MRRTSLPWTPSKRGLRCRAGKDQSNPPEGHAHRDMVPGRSPRRSDRADQKTIRGIVFPQDKITRRWARRGTRPSAPKDQRTKSAYIFGAICPEHGKGAGLVLPFCNTETMSLHLTEISLAIAPRAHAVVLMDQAGWHMTGKLVVPDNISIIALPAKCPELNPVENICRVGGGVTAPTPHRPGRAVFPHPVPQGRDWLAVAN